MKSSIKKLFIVGMAATFAPYTLNAGIKEIFSKLFKPINATTIETELSVPPIIETTGAYDSSESISPTKSTPPISVTRSISAASPKTLGEAADREVYRKAENLEVTLFYEERAARKDAKAIRHAAAVGGFKNFVTSSYETLESFAERLTACILDASRLKGSISYKAIRLEIHGFDEATSETTWQVFLAEASHSNISITIEKA